MTILPMITAPQDASKVKFISPLALAFVGDAVQQLAVRTGLVSTSGASVGKLHVVASGSVKAIAQAKFIEGIMSQLTEEEQTIFKSGRNTKINSVAKNASVSDYRKATGYETLIGYLYLTGNHERLQEIFNMKIEESGNNGES